MPAEIDKQKVSAGVEKVLLKLHSNDKPTKRKISEIEKLTDLILDHGYKPTELEREKAQDEYLKTAQDLSLHPRRSRRTYGNLLRAEIALNAAMYTTADQPTAEMIRATKMVNDGRIGSLELRKERIKVIKDNKQNILRANLAKATQDIEARKLFSKVETHIPMNQDPVASQNYDIFNKTQRDTYLQDRINAVVAGITTNPKLKKYLGEQILKFEQAQIEDALLKDRPQKRILHDQKIRQQIKALQRITVALITDYTNNGHSDEDTAAIESEYNNILKGILNVESIDRINQRYLLFNRTNGLETKRFKKLERSFRNEFPRASRREVVTQQIAA